MKSETSKEMKAFQALVRGVVCSVCGRRLRQQPKYYRRQVYPYGTEEITPVCWECAQSLGETEKV